MLRLRTTPLPMSLHPTTISTGTTANTTPSPPAPTPHPNTRPNQALHPTEHAWLLSRRTFSLYMPTSAWKRTTKDFNRTFDVKLSATQLKTGFRMFEQARARREDVRRTMSCGVAAAGAGEWWVGYVRGLVGMGGLEVEGAEAWAALNVVQNAVGCAPGEVLRKLVGGACGTGVRACEAAVRRVVVAALVGGGDAEAVVREWDWLSKEFVVFGFDELVSEEEWEGIRARGGA